MQIKFCYKMAKNDGSITFTANTTQENERLLDESCRKHQVENKTKEDFEQLFIKLNYICQMKSTKEEAQANSSWCNTNVINYTYGSISGFPSGSWWGIRMDCSRDRVHDPFNENIQIGPFGVTSICTPSVNLNEDIDFGNSLTFTGQKYVDEESDIDPLIKNYENQIPVRLIRSYNLLNKFAPKTGYRYDGLYIVTKFWIGVNSDSTKYYKFSLLRLNGQEPPSWSIKQPLLGTNKSLSTLHCTPMHPRNCLENSPSQYEFRKYSHTSESTIPKGKFDKSNISTISTVQLPTLENKKIEEKEKVIPESGIVMRHVFKKGNTECTASVSSISNTSENKLLNRIGMQGFKAHNTNISIRTGLYDSSHSTQHDVKKSTLSLFCRTAKSLNLLKSNQHTENLNSSNKDRNRSLDGKMQTVATNEIPKRIDYISPNAVKSDSLKIKSIKDINIEFNNSSSDTSINHCYKHKFNNIKGHNDVPNDSTDVHKSSLNSLETPIDMLDSTDPMYRNETSTHKMVPKEVQELRSIDSIESLTPDKILHLINKKCHPLSKLLMGNMIGLTSEQSIGLKTHDLLTVQSEVKDETVPQNNDIEETKEKKKFEAISDELIGARYYKFRRRRLTRKIMKKSEVRKCNRTHNGELRKGSVQSIDVLEPNLMDFNACNGSQRSIPQDVLYTNTCNTDVQNKVVKRNSIQKKKIHCVQESTKNIKKNVESKIEARTRLRTMKVVKSSIKKHINKKQRREIANLLIDAKIGPKIRGPRNRRLRCIGSKYAKQPYERFSTVVCDFNKCRINSDISGQRSTFKNKNKLTKVSNYKNIRNKETNNVERSETLNLKRNTVHENFAVSKKMDKNDISEKILNNNNNSMNDNNKKLKSVKANVKSVQTNDVTIIGNRKRKLMETIPRKRKFNITEQKPHEDCDKNASKACKTDAVTQCTLIKGPLTRNLKSNDLVQKYERNEHYTFIKIEYGELKDMKSEVCEATKSNTESKSQQTYKSNERYESDRTTVCNIQHPKNSNLLLNSNILNRNEQSKFSMERVSAFVPVNVLDSALKIARLRSIGFKPIISCNNGNESINNQNRGGCSEAASSKVIKQNVAEKYNKYTNEENDVVVYMDDELQYQDIEDEDNNSLSSERKASESEDCTSSNEQLNSVSFERESRNDLLLEQDLESPWHGWKKVITNEDTYWVGW
ncbi:guanylate cyclase alpha-like [Hylaeus volcanicus]|uniref:guanylate cyclase alpha-like n=1 Tax=Hylaeus volcanicus TaxID=313075 RepID=UPI0023B7FB4F|nr:guanylate cyclase alpha-like [Hylaeus volcanicus]